MSSFRTLPSTNPSFSRMEFDYYHEGTDEEFEKYFKFVRQVAEEDFELCEKAQKGLEAGIYGEGVLNPMKENGVSWYQQRVRSAVREKWALEKAEAAENKKEKLGRDAEMGLAREVGSVQVQ